MARIKASTIDEYIKNAPEEAREKLAEMRFILNEVAPKAKEAIKWGHPVFEEKRILFSISAHKTHLNFMPTRTSLAPFEKDLADYVTGQDTIQFPYHKPLPKELIVKIATYRAMDVRDNDARWM